MKIFSILVFSYVIFLNCNKLLAQNSDYKPVSGNEISLFLSKIEAASTSLSSIQSSFIQKKSISVLSETVVSKGNLFFKKPNKLSWEYVSPYFYLFAMNGDKVYIKNDKSTSQYDTKSNALFKEISLLLVNSISGTGLIDPKKFDVSYLGNQSELRVKLIPKNKTLKSLFSYINLYFSKTSWLVQSIEMAEPSGDSTIIEFNEVKLNQPVSDEKFIVH